MPRLVVNPGTPQAWEIQLKPGTNLLGRGFSNDFKIEEPSVSGSHCEIIVGEDAVMLKDLGSTNGTFLNNTSVQETRLETRQAVRLGNVEMTYYSDGTEGRTESDAPPQAAIRISTPAPPEAPPMMPEVPTGARFCKFHPRSLARYLCNKCNRSFCELCVTSRSIGGTARKICRSCGVECVPLPAAGTRTASKGFSGRLPGAFVYPFRGRGVMVLIAVALLFSLLDIATRFFFIFAIFLQIVALGYLFSYMQTILHATAAEDDEMPELPAMEGLFGAFLRMVGTVLVSFGPAILVAILALTSGQAAVGVALIPAVIFGCVYFPMAFLAVAMKDSVMSANPLLVVPSIFKVPLEYLITVIVLGGIFGMQKVVDLVLAILFPHNLATLATRSVSELFLMFGVRACWSLISVYLLTVNTRILGLLYLTKKTKLGWFSH